MASILVVEDVPAVLVSMRIVLEGKGYTVTGASDGAAGLRMLEGASYDLVVTDIWMPGCSGRDIIRAGRARSPKTRFLAVTGGDPNVDMARETLQQQDFGADRVLLKPFKKEDFLSAVADLLDAR
jgi:CheY-like chemotaxis protein